MMTVMRTPTCVNYFTVMNAIKYLTPKGLRRVWVATPARFVAGINSWHSQITALDDSRAAPGVSKDSIQHLLKKYGWTDPLFQGRTSSGWYLMQFLNLAFVLNDRVADVLLLHDADMMILPQFKVFGDGEFVGPSGTAMPKFSVKVGGVVSGHSYDFAYRCLTGKDLIYPASELGSYVAHTWVAFRPFLKELLDTFGFDTVREHPKRDVMPQNITAAWVENIVQCLNPERPHMGFGESCSYISHVIGHHRDAVDIQTVTTWIRNMWKMHEASLDGYCCPTQQMMDIYARTTYEFVGFELGHEENKQCGYRHDPYYLENPYPPTDDVFWEAHGISWDTSRGNSDVDAANRNLLLTKAQAMFAALETCVAAAPLNETKLDMPELEYMHTEYLRTASGKYIRCLAQRPETMSMVFVSYGHPRSHGVLSAALGLQARDMAGAVLTQLVTAEADAQLCKEGEAYLRTKRVDRYVNLRCGIACDRNDEQRCFSEFRQQYCAAGKLDVLVVDFSLALPPVIYRSVLKACRPRVLFVENSGLQWWKHGMQERDSHPEYSESRTDSWHHFEGVLHALAEEGRGPFRLVVDRQSGGFPADDHDLPENARRFSVYMAVDDEYDLALSSLMKDTEHENIGLEASRVVLSSILFLCVALVALSSFGWHARVRAWLKTRTKMSDATAIAVIGFMLSNGLLLVFNKVLVTYAPLPSLLLCCQCSFSAFMLLVGHFLGLCALDWLSVGALLRFCVVPLSIMMSIYSNMRVLETSNLETLLVFRPSVILASMLVDYLFLGRHMPSAKSLLSVALVFVCLLVYCLAEERIAINTWIWLAAWYVATIFDAAYIKHSITVQPMSTVSRTFYTNLIMAVAMAPTAIRSMRSPKAVAMNVFFNPNDMLPTLVLSASCIFGLSISFCGFASRQALAAASFELLGLVCKLIPIMINVILWKRHATLVGIAAVVVSIFAASAYEEAPLRVEGNSRRV